MEKTLMKDIILSIVKARNAIKAVELALAVIDRTMPVVFEVADYHKAIQELLSEGEITELEYLEPDSGFMMKRSLYFSKGIVIVKGLNERSSNEVRVVGESKGNIQIPRT
jgi:hypothetical protein